MKAGEDLLQGIVRWRQNQKALKSGLKTSTRLEEAVESSHEMSSSRKIQHDLSKADERSAHHLAVPAKKERLVMGKLKLLGLILLFLLAGVLFFIGGFLTCYTVLPPSQTSYSSHLSQGGPYGTSRPSQGLGTSPSHIPSPHSSYAARQSLLKTARQGQGHSSQGNYRGSTLQQAEQKTAYQAKLQAHNLITRTLNRWSMKLRGMFGYYAGSAIAPLTTGLAKQVVDKAIPLNNSGGHFGGAVSSGRASSSSQPARPGPAPGTSPQREAGGAEAGSGAGAGAGAGAGTGTGVVSGGMAHSSSSPGLYTILVQSFSNSTEAFELSGELQSNGFGAYVAQEQSGSGVKFLVKVGQFSNFTDARNASAILSQQWHQPTRVVVLDAAMGH